MSDPATPVTAVVAVALLAGLIEAASMLPYLGAVGLITSQVPATHMQLGLLGAYVVVMCTPALTLLVLRRCFASALEPRLARLEEWVRSRTGGAVWWVIGIIGALLALDAARMLGLLGSGS